MTVQIFRSQTINYTMIYDLFKQEKSHQFYPKSHQFYQFQCLLRNTAMTVSFILNSPVRVLSVILH